MALLDTGVMHSLATGSAKDAWRVIIDKTVSIDSRPLAAGNASSEVLQRDQEIAALDHFLSSIGWDLWQAFGDSVERTSDRLARWWAEPYSAKAVLILDGLSLRDCANGRSKTEAGDTGPFVPPVSLQIDSPHGTHLLALGRRKWRSQGDYPTLTHGGLSLLEVLSPFVEIGNE